MRHGHWGGEQRLLPGRLASARSGRLRRRRVRSLLRLARDWQGRDLTLTETLRGHGVRVGHVRGARLQRVRHRRHGSMMRAG